MKEKTIKVATYQEILDYYIEHTTDPTFVVESNRVKRQLDEYVAGGSPLVTIKLSSLGPDFSSKEPVKRSLEQFIMSDYSERRLAMEMERLDNPQFREDKMSKIKWIISMELDAEERWEKILKVVEEFEGIRMPLGAV
jgi:hypothetical protein